MSVNCRGSSETKNHSHIVQIKLSLVKEADL